MTNACKDCFCIFESLEDCLRHEILEHLNLNLYVKKDLRRHALSEILRNSETGNELEALIAYFYESQAKLDIIEKTICNDLEKSLAALKPFALLPYGSLVNGLMLIDSDVDIFIEKTQQKQTVKEKLKLMEQFALYLRKSGKFHQIILVSKARVPIIKCLHTETHSKIDINCFSAECVENTLFFREIFAFDMRLRKFARFMKVWFKQWRLIGQGLISSYCFTHLLLFYLQRKKLVPPVQRLQYLEPKAARIPVNVCAHIAALPLTLDVHRLIRDFFLFYERFEFEGFVISTYLGKVLSVSDAKSKRYLLKGTAVSQPRIVSFQMLQTDTPLIVHDCFQYHLNISRSVSKAHLDNFRHCLKMAVATSCKMADAPKSELYEALLYGSL